MAILTQKENQYMVVNGWYGKCRDASGNLIELGNCPEFDLNANSDKIKSVYWIKTDNTITSFNSGASADLQDFTSLKCGAAYLIYLQKGTGVIDIPNFVASYPDEAFQGRITDNCDSGGGVTFSFDTIESITEEVDEGYASNGATAYDAQIHNNVITGISEAESVDIKANGNNIQYSMDGTVWVDVTSSSKTISSDFTNLQLRLAPGLNSTTFNRTITLEATPSNGAFLPITKTITFSVTVNDVSISATKDIDEVVEEGSLGQLYSFDISYLNLKSIEITGGTVLGYSISTQSDDNYQNSLTLENASLTASPVKIYVKLNSPMPGSSVSNVFQVTGKRRNSGGDIVLTNAVTADATVAPRPQITSLSVNPTSLQVSISFSNRSNYGGHHWHYQVKKKSDNSVVISTQMPTFDQAVTFDQDVFVDAGTYVMTAWIVTASHEKIPLSNDKIVEFNIAANNATLSLNKSAISDILDIDESIVSHTVAISSNNLSNITLSPSSLTNWEVTSSSSSSFVIKLKDSVKSTDLSSGFVDLAQETITVTGDVGDRDTSGDSQKSESVTLNAKLVDDAELTITPPSGQSFSITDNRNYGTGSVEFGPYTINADAVTLSASTLTHWEVEVNNNGVWTKSPNFSGNGTTTFKLRQPQTSVGDAYNDTFVITPSALSSDHDASDNPNAITLTLNGKIIPLQATFFYPGKQTLNAITSGQSSASKSFTVTGNRIENITISNVSAGWNVTPSNPSLNGTVTIAYTGDEVTVGEKTGTFKISAEAITGSVLTVSEYTVELSLTVNPKISSISANPSSVTLDDITTGTSSDSKSSVITSSNVDNIIISSIPSGFIVKNGTTPLNESDSIGTGTTLNIEISDINTLGNRSGTIVLTGTSSANSAFSSGNTKNINVSAKVNGLATSLSVNPTTISDSVNQYEATPSAHQITLTQSNLESVTITGGNASKYQVSSSEGGSYTNSLTLNSSATSFWVKLMSSSSSSNVSTTFNVSGTKSSIGASNPSSKTVTCTATITPFSATLNINPTSVSETYDQEDVATAKEITITQSNLSGISLTATGSYHISATQSGSYGTTLSLDNSASSFWVKLIDTSTAGSASGSVSLVGSHTLGGGSTTKTLSCSATINETGGLPACCVGDNAVQNEISEVDGTGTTVWGVTFEHSTGYKDTDKAKTICYNTNGSTPPGGNDPSEIAIATSAYAGGNPYANIVGLVKFGNSGVKSGVGDDFIFIDHTGTCWEPSVNMTTYDPSLVGMGLNVVVLKQKV